MNVLPRVRKSLAKGLARAERAKAVVAGVLMVAAVAANAVPTDYDPTPNASVKASTSAPLPALLLQPPHTADVQLAAHYSHSSHSSHASHASHFSHYSSRY